MRISALLVLSLLLVSSACLPRVLSRTTTTKQSVEVFTAEYKYLVHVDLSSGEAQTVIMSLQINMTIMEYLVRLTVKISNISSEASLTTSPYTRTTTITLPPRASTVSYTISKNNMYNDLLSDLVSSTKALGLFSPMDSMGLILYAHSIESTTYNGLPSLHFKIHHLTITSGGIIEFNVDINLHSSLLIPIHIDTIMKFNTTSGGRLLSGTLHGVLELMESDFSVASSPISRDLGKAEIYTGGLPGADISLRGRKGNDKINATNTGSEPGYLLLFFKRETQALSNSGGDNKTLEILTIPAGETREVKLGFPLGENVNIEAKASGSSPPFNMSPLTLAGITAGIILLIILVYVTVKAGKRTTGKTLPGGEGVPASEKVKQAY